MVKCTIYKNIFSKEPHYLTIDEALERIRIGKSKIAVEEIRSTIDKDRKNNLKQNLPSVCFSGKFKENRTDDSLIKHSGYIVLDFDEVSDIFFDKRDLSNNEFVYACWISPSGNGLKALIKIADTKKHREHFQALEREFKNVDKSGVNPSRVCYESFDNEIYINKEAKVFGKFVKVEKELIVNNTTDNALIFQNILTWLSNKGDAFVTGERNLFTFKLGAACCRFGINESECISYASLTLTDSTFSRNELVRTVKSAYKTNGSSFGTAEFTNDTLVDKVTKGEIETKEIDPDIYNLDIRPKDVIFGEDVKKEALDIYDKGYQKVDGINIPELDYLWKLKRGEITLLSGIGNYGKSSFLKWYLLVRIIMFKDKFALFSPEDNPAEEFYHDLVEIYLGCNCTPFNPERPSKQRYDEIYDLISKSFFYIYPKEMSPTPDYIKERFLELIIKEKVTGCIIDPFNQMTNNYNESGGRTDKYLETFLSDCSRFAQINDVYFLIVAHPKMMRKDDTGNYPCPDVFDIADGAMWNNKMDNIIIYHRQNAQTQPDNNICEFYSKKIRRQKIVGKKGFVIFELNLKKRRYIFKGIDVMASLLNEVMIKQPQPLPINENFDNEITKEEIEYLYDEKEPPF